MSFDSKRPDPKPRTPPSAPPCPVCGKAVLSANETAPFCSARCRKVDLGRWLSEGYVISRPIEQRDLEEGLD